MIKRYKATADTTITNAFKFGNLLRATGSNMGASDSLEVFALFDQESTGSEEYSRILVKFDVSSIITDRNNAILPASGSVKFKMKLYDVAHDQTLPENMILQVSPVTSEWDEGYGKDLDNYRDRGYGVSGSGATWVNRFSSSAGGIEQWTTAGGDFDLTEVYTQTIVEGYEDLDIDITNLVESWIASERENYGVGIFVTGSQAELSTKTDSMFTKKFSARGSEYYVARPIIQAEFDDRIFDDRGGYTTSASFLSSANNLNYVYLYNYVNGALTDFPVSTCYIKIFDADGNQVGTTPDSPAVGGKVSTGIYSASFAVSSSASILHDVWYGDAGCTDFYYSGTMYHKASSINIGNRPPNYLTNFVGLKSSYGQDENVRFRVHSRDTNVPFNSYVVNVSQPITDIIPCYWRLKRVEDDLEIIPFLTGSSNNNATGMSYDVSGSYFDFDMSILQAGYSYQFELATYLMGRYVVQKEKYKFRVETSEDI